jgi:hypothetical protein
MATNSKEASELFLMMKKDLCEATVLKAYNMALDEIRKRGKECRQRGTCSASIQVVLAPFFAVMAFAKVACVTLQRRATAVSLADMEMAASKIYMNPDCTIFAKQKWMEAFVLLMKITAVRQQKENDLAGARCSVRLMRSIWAVRQELKQKQTAPPAPRCPPMTSRPPRCLLSSVADSPAAD